MSIYSELLQHGWPDKFPGHHTDSSDIVFFTGFSFWIPEDSTARIACIALGIYLFGIVYSPGEGPVPFTYSAEAYPLYIRPIGMSLATATTWFFNFILSVTWPSLLQAFKPQGAFSWYAAWNIVGFFLVSIAPLLLTAIDGGHIPPRSQLECEGEARS